MSDLLTPSASRFVIFRPNRDEELWSYYKMHQSTYWQAEEIDFSQDVVDFRVKLTDDEREYIKCTLAFFAASDGIVAENLSKHMTRLVKLPEARFFYDFQTMIENVHAETYQLAIRTLVERVEERDALFHAIDCLPCVRAKAAWALRWVEQSPDELTQDRFAELLVAFAVVEGVFFSASFCSIFWLKKRGLMPGLTFSNELISRDENMHCEFACLLYRKLDRPLTSGRIEQIVREGVKCEEEFVVDALPVRLIGMNAEDMLEYVRFTADRVLQRLGHASLFDARNPFEFMHLQSLVGKTNFFEKRVGDYQRAASHGTRAFGMDESF